MSCKTFLSQGIMFVRWEQPTITDAQRVLRELRTAKQAFGGPLLFVATSDDMTKPPDEPSRKFFVENCPALLDLCHSGHMVFEGGGFRIVSLRLVTAGIILATKMRSRFFTHSGWVDALAQISKIRPEIDVNQVWAELVAQGISR